ncbi:hypothetical protein ACWD0J_33055 [Streptomyces sp. NPDC003011]
MSSRTVASVGLEPDFMGEGRCERVLSSHRLRLPSSGGGAVDIGGG